MLETVYQYNSPIPPAPTLVNGATVMDIFEQLRSMGYDVHALSNGTCEVCDQQCDDTLCVECDALVASITESLS
jgi:predicted metal-binding protein